MRSESQNHTPVNRVPKVPTHSVRRSVIAQKVVPQRVVAPKAIAPRVVAPRVVAQKVVPQTVVAPIVVAHRATARSVSTCRFSTRSRAVTSNCPRRQVGTTTKETPNQPRVTSNCSRRQVGTTTKETPNQPRVTSNCPRRQVGTTTKAATTQGQVHCNQTRRIQSTTRNCKAVISSTKKDIREPQTQKRSLVSRVISKIAIVMILLSVCLSLVALLSMHDFSQLASHLPFSNASRDGIVNPSSSLAPSPNFFDSCSQSRIDNSTGCTNASLAAINNARKIEGISPMILPANFTQLSTIDQLTYVLNSERTARNLSPINHVSQLLNKNSFVGAHLNQDPNVTSSKFASSASLWAGGIPNVLAADYLWMYDDGPNSFNVDCSASNPSGCWAHRDSILENFGSSGTLRIGADLISHNNKSSAYYDSLAVAIAR